MPFFSGKNTPVRERFRFKGSAGRLYTTFSSLTASVYILAATVFFYIIGTIFPQGGDIDEYVKAGGKYLFLVRAFRLLDIFSSPLFLIAAFILFINLAVCLYDRLTPALIGKSATTGRAFEPSYSIVLTQGPPEAEAEARRAMREELGFRPMPQSFSREGRWVLMEKGFLPHRLLTWLYHLGIAVCFFGLLLTYLFAYEDTVTLYPGKHKTIAPAKDGRIQGLWRAKPPESKFSLLLEEFRTDYAHSPVLDYPKEKTGRFAVALGWMKPAYAIKDDSYFPKDWKSALKVMKDNRTAVEKTIEVNDPLKYAGYTFYQSGYEQAIKVRVDGSPILLETKAGDDLIVPGLDSPLQFSVVRTGTLYRLDGAVEKIAPFTSVRISRSKGGGAAPWDDDGVRLSIGSTVVVDGKRITFSDFEEASVLSYRFDPGVPVLWWAGIFVLAMMCIRFYGRWYLLAFRISEDGGITFMDIYVSARGLSSDKERLVRKIEHIMTRSDIKPFPLSRL